MKERWVSAGEFFSERTLIDVLMMLEDSGAGRGHNVN